MLYSMRTSTIWALAIACVIAGVLLRSLPDASTGMAWGLLSSLLVVAPVGLAANVTARRRRAGLRQDSTDSVEFHAAQSARSLAFGDAIILAALLCLGLAVAPGPFPAWWSLGFLVTVVISFWWRYRLELGRLRG